MLDSTDIRLLSILQLDANLTAQNLSEELHMSPSQAGRRRQRLEQDGYIQNISARLDPQKVGLTIQSFVQVSMTTHSKETAASFHTLVKVQPQIVSTWTMTGEADYLLRVYCPDLAALNTLVHDILLPHPAVQKVQSQIVMDQVKADAPLPLSTGFLSLLDLNV